MLCSNRLENAGSAHFFAALFRLFMDWNESKRRFVGWAKCYTWNVNQNIAKQAINIKIWRNIKSKDNHWMYAKRKRQPGRYKVLRVLKVCPKILKCIPWILSTTAYNLYNEQNASKALKSLQNILFWNLIFLNGQLVSLMKWI